MKTLLEKEETLIKEPLKEFTSNILLNDFKLKSGKTILRVNEIRIGNIIVDAENSEFKKDIFINKIEILTSIRIQFSEHALKDHTTRLLPTNTIHLKYNYESKNYDIVNKDNLTLVDIGN